MATVEPRLDQGPSTGALDKAPPPSVRPPKHKHLMADRMGPDDDEGDGLGALAGMPQIRALRGLKQTEQGLRDLAAVLPDIAPQLSQFFQQLEPLVTQSVASMGQGGPGGAPPGMTAMPPPPPPMPPGGPMGQMPGGPQPGMPMPPPGMAA